MDWMWAFLKATLMPGFIVGIGVQYLYHTLFPSLPPFRVRRTKRYHTRRRMDRRRERSNICQGNDGMYRGHPRHETNSKPSFLKTESKSQRELRQKHRNPPKELRPRASKRQDGFGSESHKKKDLPGELKLDLPLFNEFFDTLEFEFTTDWETTLDEPQNDGPQSLDNACIHDFTKSIDPLKALRKIKPVAVLATPVIRKKKSRHNTYRQALLSAALITGNAVSATASVYCSHKEDCVPIVIDTGASVSVTPVLADFIGPLRPCVTANLKGLSGSTEVIGEGTVNWLVRDMFRNKRKIQTTAYYVPDASIRLFSPQTYFKEKKAGSLLITHDRTTLTLKDGSRMDFPYQENNLPLMLTDNHFTTKALTVGLMFEDATVMATLDVTDEMNQNFTAPQRELMLWHQKWAHCDIGRVRALLATSRDETQDQLIEPKHAKASSCPKPKCAACCLSKTGRA
jgi:hypothetical protein